jgi:hypothetical protein
MNFFWEFLVTMVFFPIYVIIKKFQQYFLEFFWDISEFLGTKNIFPTVVINSLGLLSIRDFLWNFPDFLSPKKYFSHTCQSIYMLTKHFILFYFFRIFPIFSANKNVFPMVVI